MTQMSLTNDDLRLREHLKSFIKQRREELGLSQADLARATGDSDAQISRVERGLHSIQGPLAIRLAKALDCSTDDILGYHPDLVSG
jgi:transcriptional regulator with XRE-family HTH domain